MNSIHNIYDAFLYKYKKFILALTYTPGFNINYIIDDIAKTFNLQTIKLEGDSMLTSNSKFDYSKLSSDVNKLLAESDFKLKSNSPGFYGQGILIHGLTLPTKNLDFQIDLQLHFSTTITMFLKSNIDSDPDSDSDGIIKYTVDDYNKFKDLLSENKINKYFNLKTDPAPDLNDSVFDKIIDFMEIKVYGKDYEKYATKIIKEKVTKNDKILTPLVNPKPTDVLAISEKNQLANEKRDELLTDTILSSVSDIFDANDKYPTKKSHTNYSIYKKMAKNIELSEAEYNMSDMDLLTGNDHSSVSGSETDSDADSDTNSDTNSDTDSGSETIDLMLKDDIEISDSAFIR